MFVFGLCNEKKAVRETIVDMQHSVWICYYFLLSLCCSCVHFFLSFDYHAVNEGKKAILAVRDCKKSLTITNNACVFMCSGVYFKNIM